MLRRYRKKKSEASRQLTFAIQIAELCHDLQLTFVLEHPWSDASWTDRKTERLAKRSGVHVSKCDQCMTGLLSFHTTKKEHRSRDQQRQHCATDEH